MEEDTRSASQRASGQPLRAEPGMTAVAGEIRTLNGQPLEGVSLRVADKATRTDDTGRFLLTSISPGHHELLIDGRTASRPGRTYGVFEVGIDVRAGRTTVLPFRSWMPEIDTAHAVLIPSPTPDEVVVTTPHIPGWELHLPPGTIIRDRDGHVVTQLSITPIPVDRPPFPLPFDVEFPMYFTIQPGGASIEPYGARIIYPNITSESPGTRINFWNYDPEVKGWHIYGRGTVTPDRAQVVPDEGVVIYRLAGASAGPLPNGPRPGNDSSGSDSSGVNKPEPSAGDPVDLATGLFVFTKTDLFLPDVLPIALTRTQRPANAIQGLKPFGIGSGHIYEIGLFMDTQHFQEADLVLSEGGRVHYSRISPGTGSADALFEHTATPSLFFGSRLRRVPVGPRPPFHWELTLKDGSVYEFSDSSVPLLVAVRDRNGNRITILRRSGDHGRAVQVLSPNGRWLTLTLDDGNRVIEAQDSIGRVVTYTYTQGNLLSTVTDAAGGLTEYTYDSSHGIRTVKDPRGIVFLTNEYDGGRVIKQTQADGSTYQFAYTVDDADRITQTLVTDPRGNIRRVTFNADGYIVTDTRAVGTAEEQTITYEREPRTNLVLRVTDALGRKTVQSYDAMGNVTAITRLADTPEAVRVEFIYEPRFNQVARVTDPLGHSIALAYDQKGNLITITDALRNSITVAYNSQGQPVSFTDALGHAAQLTYDLGVPSGMIDPARATTTRSIDHAGRPITLTDPLGHSTTYAYNAHNQLTQVTDPLGGEMACVYDPNGNLLSVTDARGSVTQYAYDDMDRLVSRTDPLGRSERYERDAAGNLTRFTDRRSQLKTFTYDALNRLTQVTHADGSTITYTYDAGNRLTHIVDSVSGTITLAYDNLDRLTEVSTSQGTISYTYDTAGRRTSMAVQGQPPVTYRYDNVDRLTEIAQGTTAIAIGYDAAGRATRLTLPGEVVVELSYDAASQLTRIIYKRPERVIGELTYQYDPAGRRAKTDGSFARAAVPEEIATITYNAANQLTQRDATSLTYDNNGNLIGDGITSFDWDARNQLASMSGPGISASFQYDALGRRVRKTVNGTTTEFLYDGRTIVQELSGGLPIANLLTGPGADEYFIRTTATASHTLLFDALGSTLGLLDSDGVLQTEYTYEPFGATTAGGAASPNSFQYTGRENDGTGLYYYRARYYSPTLRRFISEDPRGFGGGDANLYVYALNSPTNFTDPLGLSADVTNLVDCLDRIRQARERQQQEMAMGRRKGSVEEAVKEVAEASRELNRFLGQMHECSSPVPFLEVVVFGVGLPSHPYRDPARFVPETPDWMEELKAAHEYAEESYKRHVWVNGHKIRRWWR